MLKLKERPATFTAQVEIPQPGAAAETIDVEYRYMPQKDWDAFIAAAPDRSIADTVPEIIVSWSGVDMPFDAAAYAELCNQLPGAPLALWNAYHRERWGARTKNS